MNAVVVFEWSFSPSDYFEEQVEIVRDDYTLKIVHGKAEAQMGSAAYEANPSIRHTLHEALNDRFLAVQLLSHRAYELSRSTMTRVHPDGRKAVFVDIEPAHLAIAGGRFDIQVRDKDGNIVVDSRRDRIEKKRMLAELITTYRASDETLASLLRSYDAAVSDPNNELVHLYEIREALSVKFGEDTKTRSVLGISTSDWSRFGLICNNEPLRQGRHRGKSGGALRDATASELGEARDIGRGLVEAYLLHIDSSPLGGG